MVSNYGEKLCNIVCRDLLECNRETFRFSLAASMEGTLWDCLSVLAAPFMDRYPSLNAHVNSTLPAIQ